MVFELLIINLKLPWVFMHRITAGLYQGCYYIGFRLVHYAQAQLMFEEVMLCCAHFDLNQEEKDVLL